MMSLHTLELGPPLKTKAPDFSLVNHEEKSHSLDDLMGEKGVLLGFIGDIWQPTSVRRILWLQRHVQKFANLGTPVALLIRDHPFVLFGFHSSSPLPVPFPMLSDADGEVHRAFGMDRYPGLLLLDEQRVLQQKWLVPDDRVWPKLNELIHDIEHAHY